MLTNRYCVFGRKNLHSLTPGGNVRQYRKEDIENIRLVYHLVKEKGLTLQGAKQKLKVSKDTSIRTTEIIDRLLLVREELASMRKELDYLT